MLTEGPKSGTPLTCGKYIFFDCIDAKECRHVHGKPRIRGFSEGHKGITHVCEKIEIWALSGGHRANGEK